MDPVHLKLSDEIYNCEFTKLLNTVTYTDQNIKESECLELFVPIEMLSKYIIVK